MRKPPEGSNVDRDRVGARLTVIPIASRPRPYSLRVERLEVPDLGGGPAAAQIYLLGADAPDALSAMHAALLRAVVEHIVEERAQAAVLARRAILHPM
ncbi:MAG: hypothetical protein ACJ8AO_06875 [Gemmatimonadaceae bacterium]